MRPARAVIDLSAFRHNYNLAKAWSPSKALAVVKADAYGHGAVRCAQAIADIADGFAVACLEEALELRAAGIRQPIVLLEGFFQAEELPLCVEHDLWLVIHSHWQLEKLEAARLQQPLQCWLKMDSGMHRVGFFPHEYAQAWQRLRQNPNVAEIVVMTHLARADELGDGYTAEQVRVLHQASHNLAGERSLCNSAAVLGWPAVHSGWTRPGIMLYGSNPLAEVIERSQQLQSVMSLESSVIALRELPAGEPVGYAGRFVTPRPSRIAIVALGYADGYPRHAQDGTPVVVDGQRARLAGRVSMDMLAVDVTELPQVGVGSQVELWGKQLAIDEVAGCAGTIAYSLLTAIKRVRKDYRGC